MGNFRVDIKLQARGELYSCMACVQWELNSFQCRTYTFLWETSFKKLNYLSFITPKKVWATKMNWYNVYRLKLSGGHHCWVTSQCRLGLFLGKQPFNSRNSRKNKRKGAKKKRRENKQMLVLCMFVYIHWHHQTCIRNQQTPPDMHQIMYDRLAVVL